MDSFKVRSKRALSEMETFVFIGGRADHMKGYHDDLLMSIAMCCFVGSTSFKDLEKSKGQAKAMIGGWSIQTTTTEEVDGLNEVVGGGFYTDNNKSKKPTVENTKEFSWLFGDLSKYKK